MLYGCQKIYWKKWTSKLWQLKKSLKMLTIQKIEKIFSGHVRRLPGGSAGAGQVQREGARRPYCRHSYQCIHRWASSTSFSLMSMTSEDRRLRIVAIYKRHWHVGSTSSLSWPSLSLSWEVWSIHDLSITSDNLCQYVALFVFDVVYSDVWQQPGPHRIWEASQLTIFKLFPMSGRSQGPRRRNKINTTHHIPSLPQK